MNPWHAWHLHYHGDLTRLLAGLIGPLLIDWTDSGEIDRFFFVRYELGGPHLRLRLRLLSGIDEEDLNRRLTERATDFFRQHPSQDSWSGSRIREANAKLLAADPAAALEVGPDDPLAVERTIPDETILSARYRPEIERYGGQELSEPNHDFFALSSVIALEILHGNHGAAPGERPSRMRLLPLLLAQTIGGSADAREARTLVRYPPPEAWKTFAPVVRKADALFERESETFAAMFRETLARMAEPESAEGMLASGAGCLARLCRDSGLRRRVLGSQLHMTANRLGLSNAEEVYLCQIATRCLERLDGTDSAFRIQALETGEAEPLLARLFEACFGKFRSEAG